MRTRRTIFGLLSAMLVAVALAGAAAGGPALNKVIARRMIRKTAVVIRVARRRVREQKVYTGDLARAVAHQKFAKHLFRQGDFVMAMHQTRRARRLAVKAIIANHGRVPRQAAFSPDEERLLANGPPDEQLGRDMRAALPSEPLQDEAIINAKIDVDLD